MKPFEFENTWRPINEPERPRFYNTNGGLSPMDRLEMNNNGYTRTTFSNRMFQPTVYGAVEMNPGAILDYGRQQLQNRLEADRQDRLFSGLPARSPFLPQW